MKYIENEGALFRGSGRSMPKEIWNGSTWLSYKGSVPKPIEWGYEISEEEARALMGVGNDPSPAAVT